MTNKGDCMDNRKEICPCAAVDKLNTIVQYLQENAIKTEKKIDENEKKLNNDFTQLALLTQQISGIVENTAYIQNQIAEIIRQRQDEANSSKKRVSSLIDEILKWGILLLLGFVAMKLGLQ